MINDTKLSLNIVLYPTPCKSAGILQDKIFIVFGPFADYIGCRSTAYPIERTFKAIAGISHIVQLLMFKHIRAFVVPRPDFFSSLIHFSKQPICKE